MILGEPKLVVGTLDTHQSIINGNVRMILTDKEGNIKSMQISRNVINGPYVMSAFWSGWFNSQGERQKAQYIYLISIGAAWNPSCSVSSPFSGQGVMNPCCLAASTNVTANPLTASAPAPVNAFGAGETGVLSWAVCGTFCFSGAASDAAGGFSSIGGVALVWQPTAADGTMSTSWFAQATFSPVAITNTDKLTIIWYFCMSTRLAQA